MDLGLSTIRVILSYATQENANKEECSRIAIQVQIGKLLGAE